MAASILPGLISGAAFGAALAGAGVYQPSVIMAQLELEDFHMLQTLLTATAGSAVLASLLQGLGYVKLSPRSFSSFNLVGSADANVVGGALLGGGMALAGSCPGTVATQIGLGIPSGYWTLVGGVAGGIVWTGFLRPWMARRNAQEPAKTAGEKPCLTLHECVGVSPRVGLVVFEALAAAAIGAALNVNTLSGNAGTRRQMEPVVGGLLIAGAQLVSLLVRRSMLGTSTVFDELGDLFWWAVSGGQRPKSMSALVFVSGIILGSAALARALPTALAGTGLSGVSATRAALGGFAMAVGSRVAGGCTAGHGISGMSLMSVSSIITVASMFVSGVAVTKALSF
ncbi:hypothetical protein PpBr36_02879 [Pyricularia pennisetigena]|uniref:hypothetical protein n=1 Tax=Pyricularia pennisetigena TaxID=1578925 RepID=UPI001153F8FC|nr:hypothetical protein PpBr36_02879 [Pyricularia pennisetigena]TLS30908.1 hypothetical protein PpBr36_02879 [Pyricularia pennisetigena]